MRPCQPAQQQLNGEAHVEEDIEAQPETRVLITLWIDPFPTQNVPKNERFRPRNPQMDGLEWEKYGKSQL